MHGLKGLSNAMDLETQKIFDEWFRAMTENRPAEIEAATEAFTKWFDKNPKGNRQLVKKYLTKARLQQIEGAVKEDGDDPKVDPRVRLHARFVLAMGYRNGAFNGK